MSASHDEKVRDRAYYKWLERGQPEGLDMQLWLEAEAEISAEESGVTPMVADPKPEKPKRKAAPKKPSAKVAVAKDSPAKGPVRPTKPPATKPGTKPAGTKAKSIAEPTATPAKAPGTKIAGTEPGRIKTKKPTATE